MPKTDVKIYSTDAATGSKITTSVAYVNPNATNDVLKSFAQQLNALTTNNYSNSDRIETVNLDTEGSRKSFRNLTISGAVANSTATITFNKTSDESVTPIAFYYTASETTKLTLTEGTGTATEAVFTVQIPNSSGTLYVGISEKDDFYPAFSRVQIS